MIGLVLSNCNAQLLDVFASPEAACDLLATEGFANAAWRPTSFGYACTSGIRGIQFTVSGERPERVTRIKLVLGLNGADRDALTARYYRTASLLLKRVGLEVPRELRGAMRSARALRRAQEGARLTYDPGRPPFDRQSFIIREARVRVVTIPRSR